MSISTNYTNMQYQERFLRFEQELDNEYRHSARHAHGLKDIDSHEEMCSGRHAHGLKDVPDCKSSPYEYQHTNRHVYGLKDIDCKSSPYEYQQTNRHAHGLKDVFDCKGDNYEKMYINPKMILNDEEETQVSWYRRPEKPPLSYSQLITEALESSDEQKLTLSQIYGFIKDRYAYYKYADPVWQNSIRHNLSLSKSFLKVQRPQNMPGKGGFWILDKTARSQKERAEKEFNEKSERSENEGGPDEGVSACSCNKK